MNLLLEYKKTLVGVIVALTFGGALAWSDGRYVQVSDFKRFIKQSKSDQIDAEVRRLQAEIHDIEVEIRYATDPTRKARLEERLRYRKDQMAWLNRQKGTL